MVMQTSQQKVRSLIQSLPEVAKWPQLSAIFDRLDYTSNPDWEIPLIVSEAVGGDSDTALAGAAAMACLQGSILLVDDILDNDPRGAYHQFGVGPTANLSLAIQSAAFRLIAQAPINHERKTAVMQAVSLASVQTAYGQHLDVQNLVGEENYWRVTEAKSTPFYGACYQIGAFFGGADFDTADRLYEFGALIGEIIQLEDDWLDSLDKPANADWLEARNNLLILYAQTADHPLREQFIALKPSIQDPAVLDEAQQILLSSGAVSYCAYNIIQRYQTARDLLSQLALPNPTPIMKILDTYAVSFADFLSISGLEVSKDMLLTAQHVI